jgi:peptide/nickel transport system ATP-binding protein/oligopeptide transport system ATP-binding protein
MSAVAIPPVARRADEPLLLRVAGLKKYFPIKAGVLQRTVGQVKAVDDVSFEIRAGETFSLVGESGCGKSTTGRVVIGLYPLTAGSVVFDGADVAGIEGPSANAFRRQVQMIFQDPFSSLNPRKTVAAILEAPLGIHGLGSRAERAERVAALLQRVGLDPGLRNRYPHEFSGGQRQRIGIARALALQPKLIIADEPVSALDVSIQSQVLNIFADLQSELGLTYLFISHDLAVVRHISDRVGVMYLGRMMEIGGKRQLYASPLHPYTKALLSAVPRSHPSKPVMGRILLQGERPSAANPPSGCVFRTRCPMAHDKCAATVPRMRAVEPGHEVACHLYD